MLIPEAEMQELLTYRGFPALSFYVPTVRAGKEVQQNVIIMKNLLNEAEERLEKLGFRQSERRKLTAPIQQLLDAGLFRNERSDGFVLFQTPDMEMRYYHLPLHFEPLVVVTHSFHISPLLPLLDGNTICFYILAISQKNVRLLQGDSFNIWEVTVPELPANLAEAVPSIVSEKSLQFHTGAPPHAGGRRAAVFHGHGANIDAEKDNITRFCRRVNEAIHDELKDTNVPLILAGPEPVLPIFREISGYQNIENTTIHGNPELAADTELHKKAVELLAPEFSRRRSAEIEKYNQLLGTGRTEHKPEKVVTAAFAGRVETVMIASETHCWGKFTPDRQLVDIHAQHEPDDMDLLNVATVETLLHGGSALKVQPEEIAVNGEPGQLAAILRF